MNLEKYKLIEERYLDDIKSKATLISHKKSGARIFLLANDDENKTFGIGFKTPPKNDTGVPHILEHSVLCGSRKYPVKDPFVELLKCSLNTFLNAMTFSDKTLYPVSSCNDKDFHNLVDIYMDAVLYPNVYKHEEIFKQEGWHYELESKDSPIKYNGVVYNEMKGAFSSPDSILARKSMNSLFPDSIYGVESGGDPDFIPDLSYSEFCNFHSTLYHPANSYIVLYGNMDMDEYLEYLDNEYLSNFDKIEVDSAIELQKPFDKPVYSEISYPISAEEDEENKTFFSYNVVVGEKMSTELIMALDILKTALLDVPGAPLKQALLDSGLCNDVDSSFDSELLQPYMSIICRESNPESQDELVTLIRNTLESISKNGLDKKSLHSILNNVEFQTRENDFGSAPKGLIYAFNALSTWLYDDSNPFERLEVNHLFQVLRDKIDSNYYEQLIVDYILNNNHTSIVMCKPDKNLAKAKEEALELKLKNYKDSLSDSELEKLIKDTIALKEYSGTPSTKEELASIPLLTKDDISLEAKPFNNTVSEVNGIKIVTHDYETNGISYIKLCFNLCSVDPSLYKYLPVLGDMFAGVSTKTYNYQDLTSEILMNTGSIGYSLVTTEDKNYKVTPYFSIDTKVFDNKIDKVFELITDIVNDSIYDEYKRNLEILTELKSSLQSRIMHRGDMAASTRCSSYFDEASYYNDISSGISAYLFVENLVLNYESLKEEIAINVKKLANEIFVKSNLVVSLTTSNKDALESVKNNVAKFVDTLNEENTKYEFKFEKNLLNEAYKFSSQVNYVCYGSKFDKKNYTGSFKVLTQAINYEYLWINVRVKGGAYGCGARFMPNGIISYTSYRDPNCKATYNIFKDIVNYVENINLDETDIMKYIIGTIGNMDFPLSVKVLGERSFLAYLCGKSIEEVKKDRLEVINTTNDDLRKLARILKEADENISSVTCVGSDAKIEQDKDLFGSTINLFK